MPDSLDDWIARAERAKNLAAVQANYGLDGVGNANGKSAASTQLKFLNIIGDIDPRLVRPRTQDSRPTYSTPSSQTCGPSLPDRVLCQHKFQRQVQDELVNGAEKNMNISPSTIATINGLYSLISQQSCWSSVTGSLEHSNPHELGHPARDLSGTHRK
ncbi:hypothetical protein EXIGLDRAFT_765127 [Exidia glandulosa HHB12029]|uniref:Uncharacterized protein n=1 Tax=Exidia glandulosa HHB12029 TaxID=1314781 RepID=A0A165KRG4_EXIGL|nr:hypothetical protein EXIGLDRAFT_765127 [Exidia glandulosa HHB12029]